MSVNITALTRQPESFRPKEETPPSCHQEESDSHPKILEEHALAYRKSTESSSFLGSWFSKQKEVRVFLSPLGTLETFILQKNGTSFELQEKVPLERIQAGINGAIPFSKLGLALEQDKNSFAAVITQEKGLHHVTFLPRLEGGVLDLPSARLPHENTPPTTEAEEKTLSKVASIKEKLTNVMNSPHYVGIEEFTLALDIAEEIPETYLSLIPWEEFIQACRVLAKEKIQAKDFSCAFLSSQKLVHLLSKKEKALTEEKRAKIAQDSLELFVDLRNCFDASSSQREQVSDETQRLTQKKEYLSLALKLAQSPADTFSLLLEGGELALALAERKREQEVGKIEEVREYRKSASFKEYELAVSYFVTAYRLAEKEPSLEEKKISAFEKLCGAQGSHLRGLIPEESDQKAFNEYIEAYAEKCAPLCLNKLSFQEKALLIQARESAAEYLAACGHCKLAYRLYKVLRDQFKKTEGIDISKYDALTTQLGTPEKGTHARGHFLQKIAHLQKELGRIREKASSFLVNKSVSLSNQKDSNESYGAFITELFATCNLILDPKGNHPYALLAVGSLARQEMCPYSDFEVALLLEKEEDLKHFRKVAELFHLLILSLGETKHPLVDDKGILSEGFSLDASNNLFYLCGLPEVFAQRQVAQADDVVQQNVLRSVSFLTGEKDLYEQYQTKLKEALSSQEGYWRKTHAKKGVENAIKTLEDNILLNPLSVDVKTHLLRFSVFAFESLCLYYEIDTNCHTIEKGEALCQKGYFPKPLQAPLQEYLEFAFGLRWKSHLTAEKEEDHYYCEPAEQEILIRAYHTLLKPLKATLESWLKKDAALQDPTFFATAYFAYAERLFYSREFPSAFSYLEKATVLKEDPLYSKLYGQLYFYQGDFTHAKTAWQKVQIFLQEKLASIKAETSFSFEQDSQDEQLLKNLVNLAEEQEAVQVALTEAFENLHPTTSLPFSQQEPPLELLPFKELPSQNFLKIWEKSLTLWLTAILRGEPTPQDLLSIFKSTYLKLPKIYRKEVRRQVLTQFSDRLPLLQDFYCEEGYLFSAWSKRHKWLKKLHKLLVKKENPNCSTSLVTGLYTPQGYLHKEVEKKLFQRGEVFQKAISWGNRSVNQTQEVFFKKDPESPGDEYAVFLLNHLITGQGSPPVEVLGVFNKKPHLLLASEEIKGEPLHLFLSKHPEAVSKIDQKQFSQMVLMALLIDPEDGKADNYIAQYTQNSQGAITNVHIIGIDNDHVFVKPFVQKGLIFQDTHLFIKTILFCFDQMKEPLHPEVVSSYLELDVTAILEEWLEMLCDYNMRIEKLLDKNTLNHYWGEKILIPFFMHPDQVLYLLEKMIRLQQALKQSEKVKTHLDLLKLLNPRLAATYGPSLNQPSSPLKRFELITKDLYKRAGGATFTMTTTSEIKQYTFKDSLKSIEEFKAKGFTPQESLRILSRLADHKRYKELTDKPLESLQQDLKNLLTTPYQEELLEKQDWAKVASADLPIHLGKFAKVPLRRVNLSHCAALTDDLLVSFIEGCRHPITEEIEVQRLYLQGCTGLTSKAINAIKKCTRLRRLDLQDTPIEKLEIPKSLSSLTFLDLKGCKQLTFLEVQGPLKRLILQGCTQLQKLYLYCPKLKSLLLKEVPPHLTYWASKETPLPESVFPLLRKAQMDEEVLLELLLSETTMEILTRAFQANGSLKKLSVNLRNIDLPSPKNISNLIQKLAAMKNLSALDLRGCPGLQGDQVELLIKELSLEKLTLPVLLLDYKNPNNQTLLHLAVIAQNWKLAEHFISQKTPLHIQDNEGNTPLDIARRINPEMRILLERAVFVEDVVFGRYDWAKYFGEIGEQLSLPEGIWEILQSPCPLWPNKKVADTHLLTLIPQSVNGKPLTLDYLGGLVQSPKGGGKSSKYRYYDDDVKNAIGTKSLDRSYWVLLTKDVLPNTRDKDYQDQCRELENWKQKSPAFQAGGYRVPKALEVATSVLMEHARSGTRFYSDDEGANGQYTYTRCSETSTQGYQVLIGGLAASGLAVLASDFVSVSVSYGLGGAREV